MSSRVVEVARIGKKFGIIHGIEKGANSDASISSRVQIEHVSV